MNAHVSHVTVFASPYSGRLHAYKNCSGAGRGPLDKNIITVFQLASVEPELVCRCLRHRWASYRADLGIGQVKS